MKWFVVFWVALAAACTVEKMPPTLTVRQGAPWAAVKRVIVLPSECGQANCEAMSLAIAAEFAFRGVDVVDLARLAAVERKRVEVQLSTTVTRFDSTLPEVDGPATRTTASSRTVVRGPMLSDLDAWNIRDALAAMQVDAIVRVRSATTPTAPARVYTQIRMTRTTDFTLMVAAVCEAETALFDSIEKGSDRTLRCALAGLFPKRAP